MKLDLQLSYSLEIKLAVIPELAAITVGGESVAIETTLGLEPGESCLLACFNPAEKAWKVLSTRRNTSWQAE
jgi:hypothetical protein